MIIKFLQNNLSNTESNHLNYHHKLIVIRNHFHTKMLYLRIKILRKMISFIENSKLDYSFNNILIKRIKKYYEL